MITAEIFKRQVEKETIFYIRLRQDGEFIQESVFSASTPKTKLIDWATAAGAEKVTFKL